MIKRMSLVRRRAGMSRDAFHAHWTGPHADLVANLPRIRGLRFNLVGASGSDSANWDGIGEIWFDNKADAEAAFASELFKSRLEADRASFLGAAEVYFVEEVVKLPPPDTPGRPTD